MKFRVKTEGGNEAKTRIPRELDKYFLQLRSKDFTIN